MYYGRYALIYVDMLSLHIVTLFSLLSLSLFSSDLVLFSLPLVLLIAMSPSKIITLTSSSSSSTTFVFVFVVNIYLLTYPNLYLAPENRVKSGLSTKVT